METELAKAKEDNWVKGYTALKVEEAGLHNPESEYAEAPQSFNKGIIKEHGITKYQAWVICERCGHPHKQYVSKMAKSVSCKQCRRSMALRDAHKEGFPNQDTYGNYFIAGKFKRTDENNTGNAIHVI